SRRQQRGSGKVRKLRKGWSAGWRFRAQAQGRSSGSGLLQGAGPAGWVPGREMGARWRLEDQLALQQVHGSMNVMYPEIPGECGISLRSGFVHLPRNLAIGPMTRWRRSQFADVNHFGEIHLEQRSFPVGEWDGVLSILDFRDR